MRFEKFHPSAALAPFIKELLIIECDEATCNRTLPDTSIVMSFRYGGSILRMDGPETGVLPGAVVSGLRKTSRLFHYTPGAANFLVLFKEAGIAAFTGIPAHELFGRNITSENIFSAAALSEVAERLAGAKEDRDRVAVMERFLLRKLVNYKHDSLINHAIHLIRQQSGMLRIKDLAAALHISQDPFEKRFRTLIGATPKQYASIVRLRHLIRRYPSYASLTDAAYGAGYFDQSHFIKDFRLFTGQAPKNFFKTSLYW